MEPLSPKLVNEAKSKSPSGIMTRAQRSKLK